MPTFWVVDVIAEILPGSTFEQDGSDWYRGRSVVPAESVNEALDKLTSELKSDCVDITRVVSIVDYSDKSWDSEDDEFYETIDSYEKALRTNEIALGIFASSTYLKNTGEVK